jgi:signal transduction histidine kinase
MPNRKENFPIIIYYSIVWTVALLIYATDLWLPLGVAGGSLYASLVLIGLLATNRKLMLVGAVLGTILTVAGFFLSPVEGETWKILSNRVIAIFTIWMTAFICLKKQKVDIELDEIHQNLENRIQERTQSLNETANDLEKKNGYLELHKDIAKKTNENTNIEEIFQFCLKQICHLSNAQLGHIYLAENRYSNRLLPEKIWHIESEVNFENFKELTEHHIFESGIGLPGRTHKIRKPVWIDNISEDSNFPRLKNKKNSLVKSCFAFPIFIGDEISGVMEFFFDSLKNSDDELLEVMEQIGIQIGRAMERRFSVEDKEKLVLSLNERVKELTCMSEVAKLIAAGNTMDEILCSVAQLIVPAWQFPDLILVRLDFQGKVYGSKTFPDTPWTLVTNIIVNDQEMGLIKVCYPELPPNIEEPVFLDEESKLLIWLGQNLSNAASKLKNAAELESSNSELRSLYNKLEIIREEERTRIAREIHDELGQALTIIKLDLTWLTLKTQNISDEVEEKLNRLMKHIDTTLEELNRISSELRPHVLNVMGLCEALKQETEKFINLTGIQGEILLPKSIPTLHPDLSTLIFRVYQETLTNVVKHSGASNVYIQFNENEDTINLTIKDNGKGIEADKTYNLNSFGLTGMRERVKEWGGEFKINGTKGEGTEVSICVPLLNTKTK